MPDRFDTACAFASTIIRPKVGVDVRGQVLLRKVSNRIAAARDAYDGSPEGRSRIRAGLALDRLGRRAEAARKAIESSPLGSALAFAGFAATPDGVRALAALAAVLSVLAVFVIGTVATLLTGAPPFALAAGFVIPPLVYASVLGYPEAVARRIRFASLGGAPAAVNYLAMSLAVRPSLERAVAFAAVHTGGPFAAGLRRVLWGVHTRARTRIEDAFTAFADDWGPWNEELKRALYVIAQAVRDGSREGMTHSLDRARSIVYDGARRRLQDYAAGLSGPTSALFALGVLLPLIVGSMLPLLSLGSFAPTSFSVEDAPPGDPVPWILLLDVAFPGITFVFGHHVSSQRPGVANHARTSLPRRPFFLLLATPAPIAAAVLFPSPFLNLLALGVIVGLLSLALHAATRVSRRRQNRVEALEKEFPDALFQLGSRLSEGRGLEDALVAVAEGMRRTEVGDLFGAMAFAFRIGGGTVEDALFGPAGTVRGVGSRTVRANLKMVVDLAAKNPAIAGGAVLAMSGHLRDLQGVERDLRAELRPTVDAMRATAMIFAPIVLGVTGALYALLSEAFAGVASLPMPPSMFQAGLAVYLLAASAGIVHFAVRIEAGPDAARFGAALARSLPVGFALFVATLLLADLVL